MNDQSYVALAGALVRAIAAQAALANCVMKLFQTGWNPQPQNTKADFASHEATYDGYSPATIATWGAPVLAGVGYAIYAPTQTFRWTLDTDAIGNTIGGYWLEDASGNLLTYTVFGSSIPMTTAGQAVIKTPIEVFQAG
jgi:hypothetical protein